MEVYFIRHTSVAVAPGTCYGATDVELSSSFESEALAVREKLASLDFDKVFTSPLKRASMLAAYCGFPDAQRDSRLAEQNYGEWEMQSYASIKDPRLKEWFEDYINVPATGGESFADLMRRVESFLDYLKTTGCSRVAVFAHGGVMIAASYICSLAVPGQGIDFPYGGILKISL